MKNLNQETIKKSLRINPKGFLIKILKELFFYNLLSTDIIVIVYNTDHVQTSS